MSEEGVRRRTNNGGVDVEAEEKENDENITEHTGLLNEGRNSTLLSPSSSPSSSSSSSSSSSLVFICILGIIIFACIVYLFYTSGVVTSSAFFSFISSRAKISSSNKDSSLHLGCSSQEISDRYWLDPKNLLGAYGNSMSTQYQHRPIACKSASGSQNIQLLFSQGMLHMFGFNDVEARRNFKAVIELDSECAIAYWAMAYTFGPFVNWIEDEESIINGRKSLNQAIKFSHKSSVSTLERDLIFALDKRFALTNEDFQKNKQIFYEKQYEAAMKDLFEKYTDDADIAALYGVVGVDMTRWDYFDKKTKNLYPKLTSSVQALERSLELSNHTNPLALHIYIHLAEQQMEMALSRGVNLATSLANLVGSEGANHLVHMPGHVFIRVGSYSDGINSALKSIALDEMYKSACLRPYDPLDGHDKAMLIAAAVFSGNKNLALKYSKTLKDTSKHIAVFISALFPTPVELIMARFGDWNGIFQLQNLLSNSPPPLSILDSVSEISRELLLLEVSDSIYQNSIGASTKIGFSSFPKMRMPRQLMVSLMENRPGFIQVMIAYSSVLAIIGKNYHDLCKEDGFHRHKCTNRNRNRNRNNNKNKNDDAIDNQIEINVKGRLNDLSTLTASIAFDAEPYWVFYPYHREISEIMNTTAHASYYIATGRLETAVPILHRAMVAQEAFNYAEPEHFNLPIAQCLGAVYFDLAAEAKGKLENEPAGEDSSSSSSSKLESKKNFEEYARLAMETYLADLASRPWNGWALMGLINTKILLGDKDEIISGDEVENRNRTLLRDTSEIKIAIMKKKKNDGNIRRKTQSSNKGGRLSVVDVSDRSHFIYRKPEELSVEELDEILASTFGIYEDDDEVNSGRFVKGSCCELGYC